MESSISFKEWKTKAKEKLVAILGGKCVRCEYSRSIAALDFHHVDPKRKKFNMVRWTTGYSFVKLVNEARKCVILCATCHREHHDMGTEIPQPIFDEQLAAKYIAEYVAIKRTARWRVDWSSVDLDGDSTNQKIADQLGISEAAVRKRRNSMRR